MAGRPIRRSLAEKEKARQKRKGGAMRVIAIILKTVFLFVVLAWATQALKDLFSTHWHKAEHDMERLSYFLLSLWGICAAALLLVFAALAH